MSKMSDQRQIELRRQAWLAFACSAISGHTPLKEDYKNSEELVDEIIVHAAAIGDEMLDEYVEREKNDFGLNDEEDDEEVEDPDDGDEEEEEEEEDEEEDEEEEEDEPAPARRRRAPAKKARRR